MKRLWLSGLFVSLGWFVGGAYGQEGSWGTPPRPLSAGAERDAADLPAAPRLLRISPDEAAPLLGGGSALGRPQPLEDQKAAGGRVVRASAHGPVAPPLVRAKLLEDPEPRSDKIASSKSSALTLPTFDKLPKPPMATLPEPTADRLPEAKQENAGPKLQKQPEPKGEAIPAPKGNGKTSGPERIGAPAQPGRFVPAMQSSACAPAGQIVCNSVVIEEPGTFWDRLRNPVGRLYGSAEYLQWWVKGQNTPPLVTTSPADVPQNLQGVLGGPNTTVLFGGGRLDQDSRSGARFHLGYWFDCECLWAIEGDYFSLGNRSDRFVLDSAQSPVIARPFRLRNPDGSEQESAQLVASPGTNPGDIFSSRGTLFIEAPLELSGAEANLRGRLLCGCDYSVDGLVGYRNLNLREGLFFLEDIISLRDVPQVGVGAGDRIIVTDRFDTKNVFHGGQIGTVVELRRGPWSVEGTAKVALGMMQQTVSIAGRATITSPAGVLKSDFPGGLLALQSNSGTFSQDRFAVAPELGVKLGYQLSEYLRVYAGYNFLYISSVLRPGDQIDRVLDSNQIPPGGGPAPPPPARPIVPFRTSDFWAHGLTFGIEWRY